MGTKAGKRKAFSVKIHQIHLHPLLLPSPIPALAPCPPLKTVIALALNKGSLFPLGIGTFSKYLRLWALPSKICQLTTPPTLLLVTRICSVCVARRLSQSL